MTYFNVWQFCHMYRTFYTIAVLQNALALISHISDPNSGIVKEYLFATNNVSLKFTSNNNDRV